MAIFLHFHDDAEFVEEEHPRGEGGKFVKKGTGGAKKGQVHQGGFTFAPTAKKHIVANEIAHVLKAHQYLKQKQLTPGGHYTFEHSTGHKVHVGPAFENQTYSKGWRHTTGVGGGGGKALEKYLSELHGKKEVPPPKTKAKTQPPQTKAPPSAEQAGTWKSGVMSSSDIQAHLETKGLVHEKTTSKGSTFTDPKTDSTIYVTPGYHGVEWKIQPKNSYQYKFGTGYFNLKDELDIQHADLAPKPSPKPSAKGQLTLPSYAPKPEAEKVYQDAEGNDVQMYSWDYGSKTVNITLTGPDAGNWSIYNDEAEKGDEYTSGHGQKDLNTAFESLHPRGPGGKFAKKNVTELSESLQDHDFDFDQDETHVYLEKESDSSGLPIQVNINKNNGSWVITENDKVIHSGTGDELDNIYTGLEGLGNNLSPGKPDEWKASTLGEDQPDKHPNDSIHLQLEELGYHPISSLQDNHYYEGNDGTSIEISGKPNYNGNYNWSIVNDEKIIHENGDDFAELLSLINTAAITKVEPGEGGPIYGGGGLIEGGSTTTNHIADHLQSHGFKFDDNDGEYTNYKKTSTHGNLVEVRLNKKTGSWRINESGDYYDSGTSDNYQELVKGLNHLGMPVADLPDKPTQAPPSAPTPSVYGGKNEHAHPVDYIHNTLASSGLSPNNSDEDQSVYADANKDKVVTISKNKTDGNYQWHYIDKDTGVHSGEGLSKLGTLLGANFHKAETAQKAVEEYTTPPSEFDHQNKAIHNHLTNIGFHAGSTLSKSKAKYTNPATGSKVYIVNNPTANGEYEWIYHAPGDFYGTPGTGLESLASTIASKETPPKKTISTTLNQQDLKKIGGKLGSNEGGTYEDDVGNKYYIKQTPSLAHSRNEFLGAALFGLAGGNTFTYHQVVDGSKLNVGTEWQKLEKNNLKDFTAAQRQQAKQDFALQVWVGNWDAVGLTGDNIGITEGGQVICQDFGGSLMFRAQGQSKGTAWNGKATEWDTLRNPSENAQAAGLYGDMTNDELKQSAKRLENITAAQITEMVNQYGPGTPNDKQAMTDVLVQRRDAILAKAGLVASAYISGQEKHVIPTTPVTVEQLHASMSAADNDFAAKGGFKGYDHKTSALYSKAYAELGTHAPKMTYTEQNALKDYKGASYTYINNAMRQSDFSDSRVKSLTDYLNTAELPTDTVLWRRLREPFASTILGMAFEGFVYKESGFSSTSLDPMKMKSWGPLTLVCQVPKGLKGAMVHNDHESEVLLQRTTFYRFDKIDWKTKTIQCTVWQGDTGVAP